MYRSRPNDKLEDDALRFLSSIDDDKSILYYDVVGSQAHSIMLHEMGHITSSELEKILSALEEAKKNPAKVQTEGYEDIHEALEAFIIKHAGMTAGGKMHTARSRNDQVVLDIRMKIRDDINEICAALASLVQGLVEKAKENKQVPMLMYTHLQQAQIGTFSHFLLSYAYGLMRDMERLYLAYHRINQSPLGACAIGGSSVTIDRKRTAMLLGFDSIIKNSVDATSSRDAFLEYASTLAILTSTLGRIAEDFIIWSTTEFGYIELAERYSSTSSAMPQKKNPDPLELTRAKAAIVTSNLVSILGIVKALPSGYSRDLQDIKPPLLGASVITLDTIKIMDGVVKSLQINKERMRQAASTSYAIAIDVAEHLVMQNKIPFRTAHKIIGVLVGKAASKGNIPLAKLEFADAASVLKAHKVDIKADQLMKIIKEMTPEKSLEARKSSGSPNLLEQEEMIKSLSQGIANYSVGIQKRTKMVRGSFDNLDRTVKNYLQS
ncbi:MAG: argininosuccinate lyase [Thermoproteota archaeon]|jgi:argininosuccinate lyase|nr:argininosuccinate lyase [Thermoproteota archaeon]